MQKYELNLREIEKLKTEQGLTGRDLSVRMGCSYQHIYKTLDGSRKCTANTVNKLARALECDPRTIAFGLSECDVIYGGDAKYRKIGNSMTRARLERNLSCWDVAALTGIPRSTLSSYEDGYSMPTVEDALKIAGALETTVEEIFSP